MDNINDIDDNIKKLHEIIYKTITDLYKNLELLKNKYDAGAMKQKEIIKRNFNNINDDMFESFINDASNQINNPSLKRYADYYKDYIKKKDQIDTIKQDIDDCLTKQVNKLKTLNPKQTGGKKNKYSAKYKKRKYVYSKKNKRKLNSTEEAKLPK